MNAAVFVEFEDLHRTLRERGDVSEFRVREQALAILEGLLVRLREQGQPMVIGRSYAAFDTYPGVEVAHDLALLGLDPQYVLVSPSGRNSADVQLTFDVARVLFRRADIELIVVVSGSRDFLPLARQVLEEGRDLRIVSFSESTSGDLRERVGSDRFWDALELVERSDEELVGEGTRTPLSAAPDLGADAAPRRTTNGPPVDGPVVDSEPAPGGNGNAPVAARKLAPDRTTSAPHPPAVVVGRIPVTWSGTISDEEHEARLRLCLELMMRSRMRHGSKEIWLSPFLKGLMSQHFAHVVHPERRALINALRDRGVIRVEERENQYADHPYSVIVIDDEHPLAQEAAARLRPNG